MQDKQYRFEVGRGLEPDLPDIVMFRIGTQILEPYFEEENYGLGIFEASKAIESILINGEESQNYVSSKTNDNFLRIFIIIMVFFVIFSFISRPYRGYKHYNGRRKKSTDDLFTVAWIASNILRGGKGGFGGGFGGFSGGSFGGGGFSGKW
jgi:uncharacterized protein